MRTAEVRAASGGGVLRPGTDAATSAEMPERVDRPPAGAQRRRPAGRADRPAELADVEDGRRTRGGSLNADGNRRAARSGAVPGGTWDYVQTVVAKADSFVALLYAAAAASVAAVVDGRLLTRSLNLAGAVDAWIAGARGMFTAEVILLLAWSISAVCGALETGEYLGAPRGRRDPRGRCCRRSRFASPGRSRSRSGRVGARWAFCCRS